MKFIKAIFLGFICAIGCAIVGGIFLKGIGATIGAFVGAGLGMWMVLGNNDD